MIAQSEGMELPELYKDIGYTKSTYFNLTSSQVIQPKFLRCVSEVEMFIYPNKETKA